jgi:hypothetical protein
MSEKRGLGHRGRDRGVAALTVLATVGAVLMSAAACFAAGRPAVVAHFARTLNGTATAHLHLVRPDGSLLVEQGPVSGALAGSASAELRTGAVFIGVITIHTHGGSITGHGRAIPHGTGRYQSFSGSFVLSGGSGRYAHISGRSGLYGVFDRRTDSIIIQTTGTFNY